MKVDAEVLDQAWVGDAVLHLFVREWALAKPSRPDNEVVERFVSNGFLSTVGQPDHVEAQIGRIYRSEGLEAAFEHIRTTLLPIFERQQLNRSRQGPPRSLRSKRR